MADDSPPTVAIRIARPYATEEEFLDQELETLTRTSVTLLGAPLRPAGVVLRFELMLSSGHVLLRGEGRVLGFKANAHRGLGGLALRFTRLDVRSKALVDKATALREQRRPPSVAPAESSSPSLPSLDGIGEPFPPSPSAADLGPLARGVVGVPAVLQDPAAPARIAAPPPDRDGLLDRLRTRAKSLDESAIRRILVQKRSG